MLFNDSRYNNYHIITKVGPNQWSTNWGQFSGFPFAFDFEEKFRGTHEDKQEWLRDNWHYSIYISLVYIILVHVLQNWMKSRESGFNLRFPLALWSTGLAIFSICGTIKCLPEFIHIFLNKGIYASFCESCYYEDIRLVFWYWLFVISKVVELGDTFFIIFRKQKLIKLHWIHHCLTLCYSWYVYADIPATARWMVNMNFLIHSIMYSYYALRALRVPINPMIPKFITISQILQMVFGFYINIRAFHFKINGLPCDLSVSVVTTGLGLYYLFLMLFVNFFIRTYLMKPFKNHSKGEPLKHIDYCYPTKTTNNNQLLSKISKND